MGCFEIKFQNVGIYRKVIEKMNKKMNNFECASHRRAAGRSRKMAPAQFLAIALVLAALFAAGGCANIGNPSGGPRDEDPPILVTANPLPGSLNVDRTKMTLTFNELVNVKDAFQNVVVSPTSKSVPRVSSSGRNVNIDFDSLAPNTTYTIDFGNSIEDNNEGNPLQGFSYSFSTGEEIDTLRIAGRVLSARNLEPQQKMLVGVHVNLNDTAFTGDRLLRVAKTDDRGRFTIRGLAPGSYRVFALDDKDNDYRYSTPEEDVAFYDVTVEPSSRTTTATDTLYNPLTGEIDTVINRSRTQFLPNDIILRSFNSELRQQYLSKYERTDSTRVFLKFNTRADSLPKIRILSPNTVYADSPLGTLESNQRLDSLVWWLSPTLMHTDSIKLEVTYVRSDQNLVTTITTDTLDFITKRLAPAKKKDKKEAKISEADSIAAITTRFEVKSGTSQDVNKPLILESPVPLSNFDFGAVHLSVMVDSIYMPVNESFNIVMPDSLQPRRYELDFPWDYGEKYRLEIDSLAAVDIYGKPTLPLKHEFTSKKADDYSSLLMHLSGLQGVPAFVELVGSNDAVQRTAPVEANGDAYFPYLTPGKYFARVILDVNGNGEYDTGNYQLNLQPELAYYYPKAINLKKNWDKEESWSVFETPIDLMKPMAITKNKPATDKRARNARNNNNNVDEDEEEELFDPTRNPFDPNDRGSNRRRM